MARPQSKGLKYFPLDVTFFGDDRRIKVLKSRYGNNGLIIYIFLLCEIYKVGYYLKLDEDYEYVIGDELNVSSGLVKQVISFLVKRSLFDSKLFDSDNVLTSAGIQRRYQKVFSDKGARTPIFVKDYWLLKNEETKAFINCTQNPDSSPKNSSSSLKNPSSSPKNDTNKIKENKTKLNEIKEEKESVGEPPPLIPEPTKAEIKELVRDELFEMVWKLYPNKKGKSAVTKKAKDDLVKAGYDNLKLAIERYKHELTIETWKSAMNGSTFFNGRYKDYLQEDYEPPKKQTSKPAANNKFHNFEQRDYDYDAMVSSLMQ